MIQEPPEPDVPSHPGRCDEMHDAGGNLRPHWQPLMAALERLGPEELQARWQAGRRLIREHGVTYTVYGDPTRMDRSWGLDLVPLLVTSAEWAKLEAGLIQRSRLLNLVLADLYGGPQRLLRNGFLPPELVYANPDFLRPCRGVPVPGGVSVHFYGCDLGRAADGAWWALADRTQGPGGAGYAWENRTVLARLLPEEIRACEVHPLGNFFARQREMLGELAPVSDRPPSIVVLTPGPHSEIYFEHAYLARHLGFPLVEGADLTVRDRRVFLKTVEGLQPVDVILRRVDDSYCDPLELRGDSFLGVPGLLDAARGGHVTMANALGAALAESPALLPFLPQLCRHLLDEELLLPSAPTWWCGQPEGLRYVLDHLDSVFLKPAFSGHSFSRPEMTEFFDARRRSVETRTRLLERLRAFPHAFVAQERPPLSCAAIWGDGKLESRPVMMRAFVAAGPNSFAVLPGALTRVLQAPDDPLVSLQSGGGSKDTWILSERETLPLEKAPAADESQAHVTWGVPSRAADHLFWLGRYTERLEQLLRVLRCMLGRVAGEPGAPVDQQALVQLAAGLGLLPAGVGNNPAPERLPERLLALLYEPGLVGGARELLARIRSTASAVRDRFSGDTWRILGRLDSDAAVAPGRLPLAGAMELLHTLVLDLAAFSGMEMENMTRGRGWLFLNFGRRLERALGVLGLLQAAARVPGPSASVLNPVLEIADSVMTYRRLFFDRPRWPGVLALLLSDASNPRSLAFQAQVLTEHARALAALRSPDDPPDAVLPIAELAAMVRSVAVGELTAQHGSGNGEALLQVLRSGITQLEALSDQVTNRYFSHSLPRSS